MNAMKTLIKNARVISPDTDLPSASVLIENELITGLYSTGGREPSADKIIDAGGSMLMPGFIDIHCHGCGGYDFCDGTPEAINTIARKKLEEGVTSFLGTTLTAGEACLSTALKTAADYIATGGDDAKIAGIHLEGPFFNQECVGAQNPAFLSKPDIDLVKRLDAICPVRKISYSIELAGAMEFTRQLVELGIMPSCAHSAAKYAEFKTAVHISVRMRSIVIGMWIIRASGC